MEELATLVFRMIANFVSEIIFGTFFYWIGWPFVKLVTWGKYPRKGWRENSREEIYVACVGMTIFAIIIMAFFEQLSL